MAALIFWVCAGLLLYSYAGYPLLLRGLFRWKYGRASEPDVQPGAEPGVEPGVESGTEALRPDLPQVAVLMAAYNEEAVIGAKLDSFGSLRYPAGRVTLWVGSDGSTDRTDELVREREARGEAVRLLRLEGRNGKPVVLNALLDALDREAAGQPDKAPAVLVLTDANVLFEPDMLLRLVARLEAEPRPGSQGLMQRQPGLVAAWVGHAPLGSDALPAEGGLNSAAGIARQESQYIARENGIKFLEGALWGCTMGAFGACYAVRRELFPRLPPHFLMEDFYVSMQVLSGGRAVVFEPSARCREDLPERVDQEFRRKVRISTGNFQNLLQFKGLLWPPGPVAFCFFSHKILRWLGPALLLGAWAGSAGAALSGPSPGLYAALFALQSLLICTPLLESLSSRLGLNLPPLRLIGYFYSMNLALSVGFIAYLRGVRSAAWQPTPRTLSS